MKLYFDSLTTLKVIHAESPVVIFFGTYGIPQFIIYRQLTDHFVIRLKLGDPWALLELSLFDFLAILNWILSNQLYFHLVMIIIHQLVWLLHG